jgi:hypothetical protein
VLRAVDDLGDALAMPLVNWGRWICSEQGGG